MNALRGWLLRNSVELFLLFALMMIVSVASAQQKYPIFYQLPGSSSKYIQQFTIDEGDVPGHQVRIYEIRRTHSGGLRLKDIDVVDEWIRGYSDYVDINGRNWGYGTYVLRNGDKAFYQYDGTAQTEVSADGSKRSTFVATWRFVGGPVRSREFGAPFAATGSSTRRRD